jgi:hypothetical protein
MFVCYSVDHGMLNFDTKRIVNSRDIKWLNLYHKDWIAKKLPVTDDINNDDNDDITFQKEANDVQDSCTTLSNQDDKAKSDVRLYQQMKLLDGSFNPKPPRLLMSLKKEGKTS